MANPNPDHDPARYPGTPRWVKVSAIVVGVLVLLLVVLIIAGVGGPHGPSRHLSSGDSPAGGAAMEGSDR